MVVVVGVGKVVVSLEVLVVVITFSPVPVDSPVLPVVVVDLIFFNSFSARCFSYSFTSTPATIERGGETCKALLSALVISFCFFFPPSSVTLTGGGDGFSIPFQPWVITG